MLAQAMVQRAPAVAGGFAAATSVISGALFLTLPGAVFAWGYDGLAFPLGLAAGALLLQLVTAPRLAQAGAASLPSLFAQRYPGPAARLLCAVCIAVPMLFLLTAELMAARTAGGQLLGGQATGAIVAAAVAVLAVSTLRFGSQPGTVLYLVMLAALLVPLIVLSYDWYALPVPQLAYANALWQIQGVEEMLLNQELADPAMMRPLLTPFLELTPVDFLGLTLGLALGVCALPTALRAIAGGTPSYVRRATFWCLVGIVLLLGLVPVAAAYARLPLVRLVADGATLAGLPDWVYAYGRMGLVEICGIPAVDAAATAQACAALPDAGAALRLQDIVLKSDAVLLAFPEIAGLGRPFFVALAAAAVAAAVLTARGIVAALLDGLRPLGEQRQSVDAVSLAVAAVLLAGTATVATTHPADILTLAATGLTLIACGLFPALFAALWWPRANATGAATAMLVGLAVGLGYLGGRHYFPVPMAELLSPLSNAGTEGRAYFAELQDAWRSADAGPAKAEAWAALESYARTIANIGGVDALAVVLLAVPAGIAALVAGSLSSPAPRAARVQ